MTLLTCPYCGTECRPVPFGKPRRTCGAKACQEAHRKTWKDSPGYKAWRRAYDRSRVSTSEYKAKMRQYDRKRRQGPERQEYLKTYAREWDRARRNAATTNEIFRIISSAAEA